ncbi:hypothetical protein C7N43_34680 [Sphingobacteriales bacterium UPWRP_1]|nr:hypothetical protein C7N43_34680 [Sphingobacteriales bacterium UPWRP_1]
MKPITSIFILLIVAAVLYFLLKTQIESLFSKLKTGVMQPVVDTGTQNNAPTVGVQIPNNNAPNLNCPITDVNFKALLFKGMPKNKEVSYLQCFLNLHGAKLTVDGSFGPKTEAALAAYLGIAQPVPPITLESIAAAASG